ncbi:asparagine synthetase [Drechmeria coniospora]|uniref:Asparagine synthetase n=1 Tax=Drechmeria coniospora TaxID=98403 RepID=A0A151GJ42_DRECN|nr:asparagine synthetase [Drechmeria coniospora]KYK57106.1 asparagine synthetase [Drechmeria coniospora]
MCGFLASCPCPRLIQDESSNGDTNGDGSHNVQNLKGANEPWTRDELRRRLQDGIDAIRHRGPDGSGVWVSEDDQVGLAHCRLSINDLSPNGSQPLHSDDGQIHAVVNGEIYDQDRLRTDCTQHHGYRFSSASDSELVIALYKIHGAPGLFEHLRGEFAFVLFDDRDGCRRMIGGRDRFGIKPLVYTILGNRVLLAAEAKAFLAMGWQPEWDVRGISDCGWLVDDSTIFKNVKKLMPGHWMTVTEERGVEIHKYWDAEYPDKTKADSRSVEEMVLGVRERLVESIRLRLRADVPVGVYLSGGIDSSAVAGIVTELSRKEHVRLGSEAVTKVSCFSIQFGEESGYDETAIAQRTAEWLGVESYKLKVTEEMLAASFADASFHFEHHHFDLNAVAKFALSDFTQQHGVKVVLTGEGSDEHFCGYPSFAAEYLREADLAVPDSVLARDAALRDSLCEAAHVETHAVWRSQAESETAGLGDARGSSMPDGLLAWQPAKEVYARWVRDQHGGEWDSRRTLVAAHSEEVREKMRSRWHAGHSAMYLWNKSIMINVILACLGDRTEMAHSIEGRTPFLDHELVEYVNGLPPSVKLRYTPPRDEEAGGSALSSLSEKWILREAARPYITDELYGRKKVTFWAPTKWPKNGPLHGMFKKLLTRSAVEGLGFVDWAVIEAALDASFGDDADAASFRVLCYTGGWVTISQRFDVKKATIGSSAWA